jgi:hypothetical protein
MYNIPALLTGKQAFRNGRADSEFSHRKKGNPAIAGLDGQLSGWMDNYKEQAA